MTLMVHDFRALLIYNVTFLDRPKSLSNSKALGEDVYRDAYYKIKNLLEKDYGKY